MGDRITYITLNAHTHTIHIHMYVCRYGWMDGWMDACMHACMHACMLTSIHKECFLLLYICRNVYVYSQWPLSEEPRCWTGAASVPAA